MKTPAVTTKTQSYRELIKESWKILKTSFWLVFGSMVVAQLLISAPNVVSQLSSTYFTQNGTVEPVGAAIFGAGIIALLTVVVQYYLQTLLGIGMLRIQLNVVDKKPADFAQLFQSEGVFWRYLGASILYGLIVVGGLILLVVPGIYWAIKYQFSIMRIVDKHEKALEAFTSSAKLTKGNMWWLVGFGFVVVLLNLATIFTLFVGLIFTIPLSAILYVVVYRKLEAKLEDSVRVQSKKSSDSSATTGKSKK